MKILDYSNAQGCKEVPEEKNYPNIAKKNRSHFFQAKYGSFFVLDKYAPDHPRERLCRSNSDWFSPHLLRYALEHYYMWNGLENSRARGLFGVDS